ncbi:MAG: hypothetical protein GQ525_14900 [Draconibacterium sp.]|nr:hypothetical protein [Draconibacterium sp.]
MKQVTKYITIILSLVIILLTGCRDEELVRMPELADGAVPYIIKDENTDQVIDFFNLEAFSTTLNYWIGLDEGAEFVQSVTIVGVYNGEDPVSFTGEITSFPANLNITIDDIQSKFGVTLEELNIGDQIIFGANLKMNDGRILNAFTSTGDLGYSAALRATPRNDIYSVFNVTCVSNIPVEGVWTSICTTDWDTETTNDNVTFEPLGNGEYALSDVTGGFYELFGFNANQPATITDVCNSITITDAANAQFNIIADPDNVGEWDPATETFTVYWFDAGNGIKGTTIITRK